MIFRPIKYNKNQIFDFNYVIKIIERTIMLCFVQWQQITENIVTNKNGWTILKSILYLAFSSQNLFVTVLVAFVTVTITESSIALFQYLLPLLMCCARIPTTTFSTRVIIFTLILKFIIIPFFIWITCCTIKTFKHEICFTNVSTSFILVAILILLYHSCILFYLEHIFSQINHEQHYSFQMDIN